MLENKRLVRFNAFSRPLPPHPQMHLTRPRPSWTLINFSPLLLQGPLYQWTGASVHLYLVLSAVSSKSPFWGFVGIRKRERSRHTFLVRPTWRGANDVQRGRETRFVRQRKKQRRGKQKFSRHDSHFGHTAFLALIGAATNCELLRVPPMRCPM